MAANGLFTYEDLYAGKSQNYHSRFDLQSSSSSFISHQSDIPLTTTNIVPTSYFEKLVLSIGEISSTKSNKLVNATSYTYLYWILFVLAILLTIALIVVFICYCRTFLKNYAARRRESLPSFDRYRSANKDLKVQNIQQSKVPPPPLPLLLPTPPCPSKSLESLNNQLHGLDFDLSNSPQIARLDVHRRGPLSTFSSSTSNLSSALQSRLSARSSDVPSNIDQLYESQRACMALDD